MKLASKAPGPAREAAARPKPAVAQPEPLARLSPASAPELQRLAGNAAVARLASGVPRVHRDALSKADDPHGYTKAGGVKNVEDSGTTRREVRELTYGVDGGFQSSYKNSKGGKSASFESAMTAESPDHMAVVVMPDKLDAKRDVQVVLHFHGFGFRKNDPYAGYTVAKKRKISSGTIEQGSVRDVDQEHWSQQIGAVNAAGGPQVVAVLVQGRGPSDFGKFNSANYVQQVFGKVSELGAVKKYSIMLSGHSGGGLSGRGGIGDRLGEIHAKTGASAAHPIGMVTLFDAEGVEKVTDWAVGEIGALATGLAAAKTPAAAQALIDAAPKFRGYFAEGKGYNGRYVASSKRLAAALRGVPAQWTVAGAPGDTKTKVDDLYRIVPVSGAGVNHEHVISGGGSKDKEAAKHGALADALLASASPTRDRDKGIPKPAASRRGTKAAAPAAAAAAAPAPVRAGAPAKPSAAPAAPVGKPATAPASAKTPAPAAVKVPAGASAAGWKPNGVAADYEMVKQDTEALAAQTPEQRAADAKEFNKKAERKLAALEKAKKKGKKPLTAEEETELTRLQALGTRVAKAQRALKRKDVEDVLAKAGKGYTVAEWYGNVQSGTFLGLPLNVHKLLAERLARAEATLVGDKKTNPKGLSAAELGPALNMYKSTSDLRRPKAATGGTNLSMHTFGLAVDLNYTGNPFLGNANQLGPKATLRATGLVNNAPIDTSGNIGGPKEAYGKLREASAALVTYLSYRDPKDEAKQKELAAKVAAHSPAKGEPKDIAGWLARIQADHKALTGKGDFAKHTKPEEGFIDLDEAVVMALTGAGLMWGGTYTGKKGAKDIMHFDIRQGEAAAVDQARKDHKDNA